MKFTIKTSELKDMLVKSIRGVGNNKLLPLTSLMLIQIKDSVLTLLTTDYMNYLYVKHPYEGCEHFYVVVAADTFIKLVQKMTSENITLEVMENCLKVTGNGTYVIDIPLDENGEFIQYPNPLEDGTILNEEPKKIKTSTINTILTANKAAVSTTLEIPCYTGYYIGGRVITTDTYKLCGLDVDLIGDKVLMPPQLIDLLDVFDSETVDFCRADDALIFMNANCTVYGKKMEGIGDFAIDSITNLLDEDFNSWCKLDKDVLLSVLDRIALFVGVYDKKAIRLTFTPDGLNIESKQSNGIEFIPYLASENAVAYTCLIDIDMLIQQVKANASNTIKMYYGNEKTVKIVDEKITQVIALFDDTTE